MLYRHYSNVMVAGARPPEERDPGDKNPAADADFERGRKHVESGRGLNPGRCSCQTRFVA